MARPLREDYPGAWHHVINRGRQRDIIFQNDDDAVLFLDTLADVVENHGIEVHAYSLMPNHYHLLVRSPNGNLSRAMQQLGREYTQRYNNRHGGDGALFRGRFKNQLVKYEGYLMYLLGYIHLNPLKAALVTRIDSDCGWTSHRSYMNLDKKPDWLETEFFWKALGGAEKLERFILALHRGAEDWPGEMDMDSGWIDWSKCPAELSGKTGSGAGRHFRMAELMASIIEITGVSRKRVKKSIRGPRGNPERRFAFWALNRSTHFTHAEIAAQFGVTSIHVARDLGRSYEKIPQFDSWRSAWEERYPEKLSIVEF